MHPYTFRANADFTCKYCGIYVSSQSLVSGVNNRNHCPNCLYSRHLDLFQAGDRLCACKGMMAPVGLTVKRITDKYNSNALGELMLVHHCLACSSVSINRIAADDNNVNLLATFENSLSGKNNFMDRSEMEDIKFLQEEDRQMLLSRLYGSLRVAIPELVCA